jgi:hypothetical protein
MAHPDDFPVLTAEQWGRLRNLVNDAGYANVLEGLSRELQRRATGETNSRYAKSYSGAAFHARKAANAYRDA